MIKRRERSQKELHDELCAKLEEYSAAVSWLCQSYGLQMTRVTIMARDPNDDTMYTCTTNEDMEGLQKACELILKAPVTVTGEMDRPMWGREEKEN